MIDGSVLRALLEALGIGFLIGVEREKDKGPHSPAGLRSFMLIALLGALAGLIGNQLLAAIGLLALAAVLAVGYFQSGHAGVTSIVSAFVTYLLGYMTSSHEIITIMVAIITATALAAKKPLHEFATQTISENEFYDTLKFLAIIFIIYPILPDQGYGPYSFFNPRSVWLFVILVSSISYIGYFLTKFLGTERGAILTAIVGGLASTTAATLSFARRSRENPADSRTNAVAAIAANTVQFPRLWMILYAISPAIAMSATAPMAAGLAGGAAATLFLYRRHAPPPTGEPQKVRLQNPFSLRPALVFGIYYAAIVLAIRAASAHLGSEGLYLTSLVGGSFDVDAIAVSMAHMFNRSGIDAGMAVTAILLAVLGNGIVKLMIAGWSGTRSYVGWLSVGALIAIAAAWGSLLLSWL